MAKRAYSQLILAEISKLRKELEAKNSRYANLYRELVDRLSKINLFVSSVYAKTDDFGKPVVHVNYSANVGEIVFDSNGEPIYPEAFVAINELGLIPPSDMDKIQSVIDKSKKEY